MAFTNLKEFNQSLRTASKRLSTVDLVRFHRMIVLELLRRLVLATPVDTGRARGNWQVSIGTAPVGEVSGAEGREAVSEGASALTALTPFVPVYIANNLAYIEVLNYGRPPGTQWSRQAPIGWFEANFEAVRMLIAQVR